MKLSLCIIVKADDSEAFYLDRCLDNVASMVDEICVTITGKKGQVPKIEEVCKKYKAKVSYFDWINDFAAARNFNFFQAKGDYILWLDADDIVKGAYALMTIADRMEKEEIDVGITDYLYDFDEYKQCIVKHRKTRIIKNDGCVKWVGKLHEDFENQRHLNAYFVEDIQILHLTDPKRIQIAKERNIKIALEMFEKDKDPRNYWNVANAYVALGQNNEAIEYYKDFINLSGAEMEVFTAFARLAGAYLALEVYDEAKDCAFEMMTMRPWFPDPYLILGEIYYSMGRTRHAKEFLIQGLTKEIPEDEYIVWNPRDYDYNPLMILARVYVTLAEPKKAKKCLESCLKIYPKNERVKGLIKAIDKEIKACDEVEKVCEEARNITDKKKLKELLDSVPDELKAYPKLCHLRNIHFVKKESSGKDLVIYCFTTFEDFNPDVVMKEGRGGSEEAVVHMSNLLADMGWNVTVYASCGYKAKKYGKVWWKPFWSFNMRDKQDVLISWRHPLLFDYKEVNAVKKYVWLHDVLEPKEFTPRRLEKIDKIFALSKYQRELFPSIPDDKFIITGNGIDPKVFNKKIERNPYRLIYTSSYDRGLKCLLKLFPVIKKAVPKAELHIFYGWDVWDSMNADNPSKVKEKKDLLKLIEQPGVIEHGRVNQEQIIEEYQKSSILVYPSEFQEISYISGMKAQAAGCIPVTTTRAALDETIQFGLKVDSQKIYTDMFAQDEWTNGVIELLKNPPSEDKRKEMMEWAKKNFDWKKVAEAWNKEFTENKVAQVRLNRFQWIRNQCSKNETIVDIGGNKGHTFGTFDRKKITTVDIDSYDIENFVKADAHSLPFKDNEFDTAILAEILEHVDNPVRVLKEAKRVTKNRIIITVPNEYEWTSECKPFKNPEHKRYYTKPMLEALLEKAGIKNYKMAKLYDCGFVFWTVICQK